MAGTAFPSFGSGTSWLPAATPVRGFHFRASSWQFMMHGSVFLQFVYESGPRGNYQLGSVNWLMADASHALGSGLFRARAMVSAEFLTLTGAGYPELLQVAEPYKGTTLTDRMHPHELVSEASLTYEHPFSAGVRGQLYVAAVGEPALGPVAYLHRPSATSDPIAPLGHHAQDVSHESFGVITAGLFSRQVHVEASVFNGKHPDEVRTNFDYENAALNSFSARITVNPSPLWSVAASGAYLPATGGAHAHDALHRWVFSLMHVVPRKGGVWSTTLVWGANVPIATGRFLPTALLETNFDLDARSALFGRLEYVTRTAEELGLVGSVSDEQKLGALAVGYARRALALRGIEAWIGARGNVELIGEELQPFYDTRTPAGILVYAQLRAPVLN